MCWSLATGRPRPSVAATAALRSCTAIATVSRSRNGSPPAAQRAPARMRPRRLASQALSAEAFAEDCARAAVVVSPREAPGDCAATLIDRRAWRAYGAVALRWTIDRFELKAARPPGYERPWARAPREPASTPLAPTRPAASDATPRTEDMEIGD